MRSYVVTRKPGGGIDARTHTKLNNGTTTVKPLTHYPYHSTGLEFGYGGSGPADLALAILADHFGEVLDENTLRLGGRTVDCPWCIGGAKFTSHPDDPNGKCGVCDVGSIFFPSQAIKYHQGFKDFAIRDAPDMLVVSEADIEQWLMSERYPAVAWE